MKNLEIKKSYGIYVNVDSCNGLMADDYTIGHDNLFVEDTLMFDTHNEAKEIIDDINRDYLNDKNNWVGYYNNMTVIELFYTDDCEWTFDSEEALLEWISENTDEND